MRKRTTEEKIAIGKIVPCLEYLKIRKDTRGYVPLVDMLAYAAAFRQTPLEDIVNILQQENTYIGITQYVDSENKIMPSIERTIETALERGGNEQLEQLGISKQIIRTILETEDVEDLKKILGEKYHKYSHEERVVYYFVRRVLEYLQV